MDKNLTEEQNRLTIKQKEEQQNFLFIFDSMDEVTINNQSMKDAVNKSSKEYLDKKLLDKKIKEEITDEFINTRESCLENFVENYDNG